MVYRLFKQGDYIMYLSALKNIFSFKGRICRRQYLLVFSVILIISSFLFSLITGGKSNEIISSVYFLVVGLALIPSQIRRLHDIGYSGWFIVLSFLPLISIFSGLVFFFLSGTKGPNKYGEDPRKAQDSVIADATETKKVEPKLTENKWITLGHILGTFILKSTEDVEFLKSLQEKMEMRYFLMLETDRLLFVHFQDYREQVVKGMLARVLDHKTSSQKFLDEYNERIIFYMSAKELFSKVGAMPGTRAFVLSHFLQKARGRTRGIDMTDVLLQKRELKLEEMSECLDIMESMMMIAFFTDQLIAIKGIIDKFKKN